MAAEYRVDGDVAIIEIDNPPVNGLGYAVRAAVADGIGRALADPSVIAVVLTGSVRIFSGGADITEFGTDRALATPTSREVIALIEDSAKPVVAAISGTALGGGLELALATHARVAVDTARLGLPEVNLGLIPGSGGTVRLPRVIDADEAAQMISSGRPRTAAELAALPGQRLLAAVVPADTDPAAQQNAVIAAAADVARRLARADTPPARTRDLAPMGGAGLPALRETVRARARGDRAPVAGIDLVARAVAEPFDTAMTAAREVFVALEAGPQSKARRYAFFAERAARKVPGLDPATATRPVHTAGVIGAGTMGRGITLALVAAGIPVTVVDTDPEALSAGLAAIEANLERGVARGRLSAAQAAARRAAITGAGSLEALAEADLIIEAVFEDLEVKKDVFTALDRIARDGAVLATNTSYLDVDAIAAVTSRPEDVLGMHFFSPADVMALLEIVRADRTGDDVLATALAVGKKLGKTTVVARVGDGFIGNRMLAAYRAAATALVDAGADPVDIDAAIEDFGFAMGPFAVGDLAGLDIGWANRKRRYAADPDFPRDTLADALCERGRFGQKTKAGWYDYPDGPRSRTRSPEVADLVADHHRALGVRPQTFEQAEIVDRLVFALADEGARILGDGIAARASDIDVVYLAGYGFPRHRGGPMFHADRAGLAEVAQTLRRVRGDTPDAVAPLLARLAAEGGRFTD